MTQYLPVYWMSLAATIVLFAYVVIGYILDKDDVFGVRHVDRVGTSLALIVFSWLVWAILR